MDFFKKTLDPVIALSAIAVLDIFMFLIVGAWTVGGGETMMTGLIAQAVMGDELDRLPFWQLVFTPDPTYWKIYISLGMLFGAFVGAVLSKEFYLRFPRRQFDEGMLEELLGECAETVVLDGEEVLVRHCYVERRLRPLNLFVREADDEAAVRAMLDYGQSIKDLARSNIFPGDLLLKNFGLTRGGRAIFYDYDELCLLDTCCFRHLPEARDEDETRPLEEWLTVREGDVFPEMFPRFLGVPARLREALVERHGEIFDAEWWREVQQGLARGDYSDIPPYPQSVRLHPRET